MKVQTIRFAAITFPVTWPGKLPIAASSVREKTALAATFPANGKPGQDKIPGQKSVVHTGVRCSIPTSGYSPELLGYTKPAQRDYLLPSNGGRNARRLCTAGPGPRRPPEDHFPIGMAGRHAVRE